MSIRQHLYDACQERAGYIAAAEAALESGNEAEYTAQMEKAKALNAKIDRLKADQEESERYDQLFAAGQEPGRKPEMPGNRKFHSVDDLKGMSAKEINAHWKDIAADLGE
jgi:hypothetical protein